MKRLFAAFALALGLLVCAPAHAGPWIREPGHFYLGLTYSRISAMGWYQLDYSRNREAFDTSYLQHGLSLYSELGLASRWLMMTVEAQLYRRSELTGKGYTQGFGDMRVGFWTGVVTSPVRLAAAVLIGIPTGDPGPRGGDIARALPTGDGEADVEARLSLGHSFGGARRWPLLHYLVAEAGYWARSNNFSDAFVYRLEVGTKLPWKVVDRFWVIARLNGAESFISPEELAKVIVAPNPTGMSNGLTYMVIGLELAGRIYKGFGASAAIDLALRARLLPTGAAPRFSLSYEW